MLDWSKFRAFSDNNSNVAKLAKFAFGRIENIVGKGENAGDQHFLLIPQCFQRPLPEGPFKSELCGEESTLSQTHGP